MYTYTFGVWLTARLPDRLVEKLDRQASEQMRTRSSMVAVIVATALAEPPDDPRGEDV